MANTQRKPQTKKLTKEEIKRRNEIGYKKLEKKLSDLLNEIARQDGML